jgi:hypothetical protein
MAVNDATVTFIATLVGMLSLMGQCYMFEKAVTPQDKKETETTSITGGKKKKRKKSNDKKSRNRRL